MKFLRLPLFYALGAAVLAGVGGWVLSRSSVQTWAMRNAFSGRVDLKVEIGRVKAGWDQIELEGIKIEQPGIVLLVPSARIEVRLLDAVRKRYTLKRLVARGWTLDLTSPRPGPKTAAKDFESRPSLNLFFAALGMPSPTSRPGDEATRPDSTPRLFEGILASLELPFDMSVESAALEGEIIFPSGIGPAPSHAKLALEGGPLAFGKEGHFNLRAKVVVATHSDATVAFSAFSAVVTEMASPHSFQKIRIEPSTTYGGSFSPWNENVQIALLATRDAPDETYRLTLNRSYSDKQSEWIHLEGRYETHFGVLSGKWACDARTADIEALVPGRSFPAWVGSGQGQFEVNWKSEEIHAVGSVDSVFENLGGLRPELSSIGRIGILADFDILAHGGSLRVEKLGVKLRGTQPVASIDALQGFEFNPKTGELKVADPSSDLLHFTLNGVPLTWVQPFVKGVSIGGDDLRGEYVAGAHGGGFALRPLVPTTLARFALSMDGRTLIHGVDFSLWATADYSPEGWQVDVSELKLQSGGGALFSMGVKLGRRAGPSQPIKAKGDYRLDLVPLAAQPFATSLRALTRGTAGGSFSANFSTETRAIEFKFELDDLIAANQALPKISAGFRADLHADGSVDARLPLTIEQASQKSDLELSLHAVPEGAAMEAEAQLTSKILFLEDFRILLAPIAASDFTATEALPRDTLRVNSEKAPFWSGWQGQLKLALEEVVYSRDLKATHLNGSAKVQPETITLEGLRASLAQGADLKLKGAVNFTAASKTPYEFSSNLTLNEFDFAPLLVGVNPGRPPTVEGRFDLFAKIDGSSANVFDWRDQMSADFRINCRSGKFHGFNTVAETNLGKIQQGLSSRIANLLAMGASMIGHSSAASSAEKGRAASSALRHFTSVDFDQLNLELSCRPKTSAVIKSFSLISPEVRMSGEGEIEPNLKEDWLQSPFVLDLQLGVRGNHANDLRLLGLLKPEPDALGYFPLADRLQVQGTVAEMNGSALIQLIQQKLAAP